MIYYRNSAMTQVRQMGKKEMKGSRFTRVSVIGQAPSDKNHNDRWHCKCDCGTSFVTLGFNLRNGQTKSCGCMTTDQLIERNTKHGMAGTSEYMIWAHMLQRCNNPQNRAYGNYGGRGIAVCPEWGGSFDNFYAHVGPRPSVKHSLDRIDNDRGYEPGNVRWATRREQLVNKRSTRFVEYNGKRMALVEALEASPHQMTIGCLQGRLNRGWTLEEALDTPPNDNIWTRRDKK